MIWRGCSTVKQFSLTLVCAHRTCAHFFFTCAYFLRLCSRGLLLHWNSHKHLLEKWWFSVSLTIPQFESILSGCCCWFRNNSFLILSTFCVHEFLWGRAINKFLNYSILLPEKLPKTFAFDKVVCRGVAPLYFEELSWPFIIGLFCISFQFLFSGNCLKSICDIWYLLCKPT